MEAIDLLISARWIIPVEPASLVLENHSIAVHNGRILAILPTPAASQRYSATQHDERPNHVLLPGFVNAHTHAGMTLLRGVAENLRFDSWLKEKIWPLEQRWLTPEFVRDGVELAIAGMVASGTTCFAEQYMYPDVIAQTASRMQIRTCVGLPVFEFATAWATSAAEYIEKGLQVHDEYKDHPLITTAFAPHSPYAVGDATLESIRTRADEIELSIQMHLHESAEEVAVAERPLARLERLGLLTPLFTAIHMTQLNDDDIARTARHGVNVVHCPQSNLKLQNGLCPVTSLLERGVNIGLGTDSAASNNDLDMLDEMRTAALLASGFGGNKPSPTAHDWLRVATLNGARSLNLENCIGSLVVGKWADLCCIDLGDIHTQPIYDPATAVVYSATRGNVSDVYVAGRTLLADHQLIRFDSQAIVQRAREWQARIANRS